MTRKINYEKLKDQFDNWRNQVMAKAKDSTYDYNEYTHLYTVTFEGVVALKDIGLRKKLIDMFLVKYEVDNNIHWLLAETTKYGLGYTEQKNKVVKLTTHPVTKVSFCIPSEAVVW